MFARTRIRGILLAALVAAALSGAGCGNENSGDSGASGGAGGAEKRDSRTSSRRTIQSQAGRSVDAESLAYAEVGEELVYGYFAFPSDMIEPLPAIIIIHDWWGLNDDTRDMASRLAAEGYMVLAVDLYGGRVADKVANARSMMISVVENPGDVESNLRQALDFVDVAGAPKKAVLGWGFGGGWSFNSTMLYPDQLDASVIYYGQVDSNEDRLRIIETPILGFFGARDRGIKLESVRGFEKAMQRLRKDLTIRVYDDVGHAFADPRRSTYDEKVSEDAWQRAVDFLGAKLAPSDAS